MLPLLVLLLCGVLWYGFNVTIRWKLRNLPGPKPSFLLGNLLNQPVELLHTKLRTWPRQYGKMMKFFMGRNVYVLCTDPVLIHQASVKDFTAFHDRKQPLWPSICIEDDERLKWDILWSKGKFWSTIRAATNSLFHTKALSSYVPGMHETIQHFIEQCASQKRSVEVSKLLQEMSLQIVGSAAFGVDFAQPRTNKLAEMAMTVISASSIPTALRVLYLAFPFMRLPINQYLRRFTKGKLAVNEFLEANGYLMGASKALLKNCIDPKSGLNGQGHILPSETAHKLGEITSPARKIQLKAQDEGYRDFMQISPREGSFFHKMIETQLREKGEDVQNLTEIQIISQAIVFILAGFDTSANALSFTLFELAKCVNAQEKIREEIRLFEANGKQTVEQEDLIHFPYTEACLLEALRMHPPIQPIIIQQRQAVQNTYLGSQYIPKGTTVIMNTHGLSVDAELFPDPLEFKPERFLKNSERLEVEHPPGFLSFGSGPHKCIGYKFAIQECIFALVAFHKRFIFTLDSSHHSLNDKMEYAPGLVFSPKKGVWLNLEDA